MRGIDGEDFNCRIGLWVFLVPDLKHRGEFVIFAMMPLVSLSCSPIFTSWGFFNSWLSI
jgi:hypothetical protein